MPAQPRALGYDSDGTVLLANGLTWAFGTGTPEGAVAAPVGSLYSNLSGGAATTLYAKTGGAATNTGWTAMT